MMKIGDLSLLAGLMKSLQRYAGLIISGKQNEVEKDRERNIVLQKMDRKVQYYTGNELNAGYWQTSETECEVFFAMSNIKLNLQLKKQYV
jgi:hypothetical protein